MLKFDGSTLKGGGQILRTATSLSAVFNKPCNVFNIRQKRKNPGLAHQHLIGIQSLARLCNGSLEGDVLGSQEIKFYPGSGYQNHILINIKTAASIALILQSLIPFSIFSPFPIKISFKGGATDTFFSPSFDHFRYVFLKLLEKMGIKIEVNILKRGYYPSGKAEVEVKIHPSRVKALNLTKRGELNKILIISGASESLRDKKTAEQQIAGAREVFGKLKLPIEEKVEYYQTDCPGSQITLIAEFENTVIGTDNLGKLGKRAKNVGTEAALKLLTEEKTKACLDQYLADQILPYMALLQKKSQVTASEITDHCKTNILTIEKFSKGEFKIKENLISWLPRR